MIWVPKENLVDINCLFLTWNFLYNLINDVNIDAPNNKLSHVLVNCILTVCDQKC